MANYNNYATNYQMAGGINPYYQQPYMGQPVQPMAQQMPTFVNALSEEEIKMIANNKPSKIDISVPQEENFRAMCTHKHNGRDVVQQINDGTGDVYCPICGERWNPEPISNDDIKSAIDIIVTQMQNCKWVGDLNVALVRDYFPMIPLLKKLPDIYEYSMASFNKYFNQNGYQNSNDASVYSQYNSLMGYGNQNFYQPNAYTQPMMQPQYQQPMQMQQPYGYAPTQNPMQAPMNTQFTDQANMMMQGGYYNQQPMQMQQPQPQQTVTQPTQQASPNNQGYMPNYAPAQPQSTTTPAEGENVTKETVVNLA